MTDEEISKELDNLDILMINSLNNINTLDNKDIIDQIWNTIRKLQTTININSDLYKRFEIFVDAFNLINNGVSLDEEEVINAQAYLEWINLSKQIATKKSSGMEVSPTDILRFKEASMRTFHPLTGIDDNPKISKKTSTQVLLPQKITLFDKFRTKIKNVLSSLFGGTKSSPEITIPKKNAQPPITPRSFRQEMRNPSSNNPNPSISINQLPTSDKEATPDKRKTAPESELIVVSDLHGDNKKWQYIKKYLNENPLTILIILGDAMDRGEYGLEILLQIRELCLNGRAIYVPGNHDEFAYDYLQTNNPTYKETPTHTNAKLSWERNYGTSTMAKFNSFEKIVQSEIQNGNLSHHLSKQELIDWLGNCPIQIKAKQDDLHYSLAHAMFQQSLYDQDPNFNLEKALQLKLKDNSNPLLQSFRNALWYRETDFKTHFSDISWPKGTSVIVGHTNQKQINIQYLNGNIYQPVIYIDCGKGRLQGYSITKHRSVQIEPEKLRE